MLRYAALENLYSIPLHLSCEIANFQLKFVFQIHFVDYGNDDECAIDVLKHLKKEYLKLPKQAFKCTLNGIQRMELGIFSAEANSKFTEVVLDKEFNLTTVKVTYSVVHVNLVEQNERNIATLDVAKILVEGGYAEPVRTNLSGTGKNFLIFCWLQQSSDKSSDSFAI